VLAVGETSAWWINSGEDALNELLDINEVAMLSFLGNLPNLKILSGRPHPAECGDAAFLLFDLQKHYLVLFQSNQWYLQFVFPTNLPICTHVTVSIFSITLMIAISSHLRPTVSKVTFFLYFIMIQIALSSAKFKYLMIQASTYR
jgi:hypothetical protein